MCKTQLQSWFMMRTSTKSQVYYLTPAKDLDDAIRKFGVLGKGGIVTQTTWLQLKELFGFTPPEYTRFEVAAVGSIVIGRDEKTVCFWPFN